MATFPTNISSMVKKLQICISFVSNLRKQCLCYLLFYKLWKPCLLISKQVFRRFFLNYTDFANKISKYDSTSGIKSLYVWKRLGMRLWIGTSTFKGPFHNPDMLLLWHHSVDVHKGDCTQNMHALFLNFVVNSDNTAFVR